MKAAELRQLSDAELVEKLSENKEEQFNLRFQNVTGQLDDYSQLKLAKREAARIQTLQRERKLAIARSNEDDN